MADHVLNGRFRDEGSSLPFNQYSIGRDYLGTKMLLSYVWRMDDGNNGLFRDFVSFCREGIHVASGLGVLHVIPDSYKDSLDTTQMGEVELNRVEVCEAGFKTSQDMAYIGEKTNGMGWHSSPNEEHISRKVSTHTQTIKMPDEGCMVYGCAHYRRRCHIRAPCCNEIFDCRHCHNEEKNNINVDQKHRHDMPRHQVSQVICSICGTAQEAWQVCINCGVCMGMYFCKICKLYDDDTSKRQFHCDGCGICRIGGRENFFHCDKCGCCYSILLKNSHPCVEGAMHHDCPVCFEFLFESRHDVTVMPCGHTIHKNCIKEMREHYQYACPLCSKSVCDMSKVWEKFDTEIAALPMPESYQSKMVWILCNDCGKTSEVQFHVVAQKCLNCKSYNTRQTRG